MSTSRFFNAVTAVAVAFALLTASVMFYFSGQEAAEAMAQVRKMPYARIFDRFQVMQVEIGISEEDWADMLSNPLEEEYKHCDVTVNGTVYEDAAIRTKGNTSLSQVASGDSDRYSFKIEFDHYDKNKSMEGLDKLVLNNLFCDASYVKEYIAYDIFRYMGVETPYYAFADISVNGENVGCYIALEAMEDSFLERVYGGRGKLYKPESDRVGGFGKAGRAELPEGMELPERTGRKGTEVPENRGLRESKAESGNTESPKGTAEWENGEKTEQQERSGPSERRGLPVHGEFTGNENRQRGMEEKGGGSDLVYVDDNPDSYKDIFDNASFSITKEDKQRVIKALEKLSQGEELDRYVDVDACLRYFAAQTFIVNMDSYYGNLKHNYYLYERDGQLTILPWDLNLAFGGFQEKDATEAVNSAIDTPMDGLEENRPLFSRMMETEEYRELYHEYLNEIAENYVGSGQAAATLAQINSLITPYVKEDATAFYSYPEFTEAIAALEIFLQLRAESVEKQLSGEIPSTYEERSADTAFVDASHISLSTMGVQGGR